VGLVRPHHHAADERVNYERLREEFDGDATTQMLARPVELELTAGEAAVFEEYREALERLGFRAERAAESGASGNGDGARDGADPASDRRVLVRTAPTVLDETLDPELLRDALAEFVSTDPDDRGDTVESVADDLLADLACYPSITGNTSLREGSVVDLLAALDDCQNPYACPHGRPVVIELSESEIAERFERDYPGHGGRRGE
jgi:DNA mismatch repair protein MutL